MYVHTSRTTTRRNIAPPPQTKTERSDCQHDDVIFHTRTRHVDTTKKPTGRQPTCILNTEVVHWEATKWSRPGVESVCIVPTLMVQRLSARRGTQKKIKRLVGVLACVLMYSAAAGRRTGGCVTRRCTSHEVVFLQVQLQYRVFYRGEDKPNVFRV